MNLIELGIDTSSFTAEKRQTLQEFIGLFNQLERYDGLKVNPVMGEGLTSFNNSIIQTSKILDEINLKLQTLQSTVSASGAVSKTTASATNELTSAEKEQARINEQLVKTWEKLVQSQSEEAKMLAFLTVELRESNKANLEEAKSKSLTVSASEQARQKALQEREAKRQMIAEQKKEMENERLSEKAKKDDLKATEALVSEYAILKKALQDQAIAYQNLYLTQGKKAPATVAALDDYRQTATLLQGVDKKLADATGSSKLFGGALSSAFGQLRTLAYILPGLGIAGIFNLAFEAIGKAAEETGLFNNKLEQYLDFQTAINKTLSETIALNNQLYELDRKLTLENNGGLIANQRFNEKQQARGYDPLTILQSQAKNAETGTLQSSAELLAKGIAPEALAKDLERRLAVMQDFADKIEKIKEKINHQLDPNRKAEEKQENLEEGKRQRLPGGGLGVVRVNSRIDPDLAKKELASLEEQKKAVEDTYKTDSALLSKYLEDQKQYFLVRDKLIKFEEDERRKKIVETTKDIISVQIEANQKVLSDERSTYSERIKALQNIASAQKEINSINAFNVTDNLSSTKKEKEIALNKEAQENRKEEIKLSEKIEKIEIERYQRELKANTEINKDAVEQNAIANERIFKNDNKTLEERLKAYTAYILEKQHLDYLEEQRDLQRGAKERGGKTSLTVEEKGAISSESLMQRANKQADAEKQVFDIVYTSTQKQLKEIMTFNRLSESDMKRSYKEEVDALNDKYEKHKIGFEAFSLEKTRLARKYRIIELENNVKDDNTELARLQDFIKKEKDLRDAAKSELDIAQVHADANPNDLDAQRNLSEAKGKYEAFQKSILDTDKAMKDAQDKLTSDSLALSLAKYDAQLKAEKQLAENRKEIIDALYNLAKTAIDGEYQKRLELLERNKQLIDEEYGYEIAAIEKSSLTAKDKAALDIQLNAEKAARDKDAAWQERELKHEQAVIDRELAIAHILWSTEEAVIAALKLPVAGEIIAAERAALGAIAIATVLAAPIPYAEGTPEGGHDKPDHPVLIGEAGLEAVKEPYKSMYFVNTPTVTYLPKGTDVIPMKDFTPDMFEKADNSWEQTRYLAKTISSTAKKEIKNIFKPNINLNLGFETYKRKILGQ